MHHFAKTDSIWNTFPTSNFIYGAWSLNAPFVFKLKISSYLNFWMKKTFFGAFKLIETSGLVEILSHFFFQKVRGQSFPNLFSKKLYDQKNKIYQTLKSSKKNQKKSRIFRIFFRSGDFFWKSTFFFEKVISMLSFKGSHRSKFLIFFSDF